MAAIDRNENPGSKKLGYDHKIRSESSEDAQLAPLFWTDVAKDFRSRWDVVQRSFVDDPRQAVLQADELVAQVMKSLVGKFTNECAKLEAQVDQTDEASTENLRLALRRYHSFSSE